MNRPPKKVSSRRLPLLVAFGVLGIGLAVTAVVTAALAREARVQDAARFDRIIHDTKQLIETRVERYEMGLAGLQEFFSSRKAVTEAEWQSRLDRFEPKVNYPGLIEVGYGIFLSNELWRKEPPELIMAPPRRSPPTPQETPKEARRWMATLFSYRAKGWPAIAYGAELYPGDWTTSVPQHAYRTDSLSISPRKRLRGSDAAAETSVFTMYLPLYQSGVAGFSAGNTPSTFNQRSSARESAFRGLLFASFSVNDFLDSIFGKEPKAVEFELFSSSKPKAEQWLNDRSGRMRFGDPNHRPYLSRVDKMRWYGEDWSLYFYTTPVFVAESLRYRPWLAAGIGIPLSFLFAGVTWAQGRGRAKAENLAESLRQSEGRLQMALKEREQISRDLHDGTIQSLYAIGLGLGQLRRALGGAKERERMDASLEELDHVVAELRSYLVTLDPGVSPAQSAAAALSQLVARLCQTAATDLRFTAEAGVGEGWPPAAVLDLLQAAREGVSNALRHGQATQVDLSLRGSGNGEVFFSIEDNGKGFEPSTARRKDGHGLANLERRAQAWNGSLQVESRPGGPTRFTLAIYPLGERTSSSA